MQRKFAGLVLILSAALLAACDKKPSVATGSGTTPAVVHAEANKCAAAFMSSDWVSFAQWTDPKIMKEMGGQANMIRTVKGAMGQMEKEGFKVTAYDVKAPTEIIGTGSERYAILNTVLTMKAPSATIVQEGYLLATTSDGGGRWYFVDGAGLNSELKDLVLPTMPAGLKLPERKPPQIKR